MSSRSTPIEKPRQYWDWMMSHGMRAFVESLGPELAAEFRTRMLAGLRHLYDDDGGLTLDAEVAFDRMLKCGRNADVSDGAV